MDEDIQKTALRLPRDLHTQILEAAKSNRRSMNAEIVARLQSSLGNHSHQQNLSLRAQLLEQEHERLSRQILEAEMALDELRYRRMKDSEQGMPDDVIDQMKAKYRELFHQRMEMEVERQRVIRKLNLASHGLS